MILGIYVAIYMLEKVLLNN